MTFLSRRLRRFRDQEDGLVMTEFLIMLPLLIWTFMALFIYWDAFRTINQAQKASYAVSDLISRQSEINVGFVNGMENVMEYLTGEADVRVRITSFDWDEEDNEYRVFFSRSPGSEMSPLDAGDLASMTARIPTMADNDSVVLVETEVAYDPAFEVGIPNHSFDNFVITRPRYYLRVCLTEQPCPEDL